MTDPAEQQASPEHNLVTDQMTIPTLDALKPQTETDAPAATPSIDALPTTRHTAVSGGSAGAAMPSIDALPTIRHTAISGESASESGSEVAGESAPPAAPPTPMPATPSAPTHVTNADRFAPLRLTPVGKRRGRHHWWTPIVAAGLLLTLPVLLVYLVWPALNLHVFPLNPFDSVPQQARKWSDDNTTTPLNPANAAFGATQFPVAAEFATYYTSGDRSVTLGPAITPAFTSNLGVTQFFTNGALVDAGKRSPEAIASAASDGDHDLDPDLVREGAYDPVTGVISLPLIQGLLDAGSKASVGAPDGGMAYTDLRSAASTSAFVLLPASHPGDHILAKSPEIVASSSGVFVVEGTRYGKLVGHLIPQAFWTHISQAGDSPSAWLGRFGQPLTEALPMTATHDGARHHLLVQAFAQTLLIADLDEKDASGAPAIWTQPLGIDYLRTLGGPTAHTTTGAHVWLTTDGALRGAADGAVAVHLNTNAPVTLDGAAQWKSGQLWYRVTWRTPTRNGAAWAAVGALTTADPKAPPINGLDTLSPDLAQYLNSHGANVGVVAYDITRNTMYAYNSHQQFIMASSAKVPLLLSYLQHIQGQGRSPNGYELDTMTAMIEHSDNNAAQRIYDTLGYGEGQIAYMRSWGINDYIPNDAGWGWAQWSPSDMAHVLDLIRTGGALNSANRALALNLMSHIESDQQFGVGDSAPDDATFAMKDGWVPGPDGAWAVNSSGIVTIGHETYIVTVYSQELGSFQQGMDITNHVCGAVAQALK